MKKVVLITLSAAFLLSSCGTYTGSGAYTGATLGSILGSAIGGISGGWHGSNVGTLIGMAGGAAVGAAVGASADQRVAEERIQRAEARAEARAYERASDRAYAREHYREKFGAGANRGGQAGDGTYYNPEGSSDDRIDFSPGSSTVESSSMGIHTESDGISISNVRFIDDGSGSNVIKSGEICKISFEVRNTSSKPLYDVRPNVTETSGNRHILVSQGISVERIAPGRGIRYTATVKADNRLKDGMAIFRVSVYNPVTNRNVTIDDIKIMTRR